MQKPSLIGRASVKKEASNFLPWHFKNEIFQLAHA